MMEVYYPMPTSGLGTDFSESERPMSFAGAYTNRFRNTTGGSERRPGMSKFSDPIAGGYNLTRMHEWIGYQDEDVLFASDDQGNLFVYNATTSAWTAAVTGKAQARLLSAQAENYLMFCNGVDRNFFSTDGGQTFNELKALITKGKLAGGSNATTIIDGNVSNWIGQTLVSDSSIVYNVTQNGYGIVTTIASAQLTITPIVNAAGGGNGAGQTTTGSNQIPGDTYQLIDYVNLEIIPDGIGGTTNVSNATTGTTTNVIAVSGVNFASTEIRAGDFIYNTTVGALSQAASVSANVNLKQTITGQVVGDALVFLKSAMPIASWIHVHYGRVYYLDSRKPTTIVISAPDDPQDVTTYQETLNSTSFSFGSQQPSGDRLLALSSFQQYFVAAGERNLYIYRGITPIADTSNTVVDFTPISFYPNGVYSRFGLGTNGTDLLHVTLEGLQAVNIGSISFTTIQNNVSVPIRQEVVNLIKAAAGDDVQLSYYPRRAWMIMKIGTNVFILNTIPSYDETGKQAVIPSWSLFTGKWAQQNHYFIRRNGDLLACGNGGVIYYLDNADAVDDGAVIVTDLQMAWLRLEEPQKTPRMKTGSYIRPMFESSSDVGYTISVVAGWDGLSNDSITVSAVALGAGIVGSAIIGTTPIGGGTIVQNDKYPLRWRGEQARIEITTESSGGPDVITGFYAYGDISGVR